MNKLSKNTMVAAYFGLFLSVYLSVYVSATFDFYATKEVLGGTSVSINDTIVYVINITNNGTTDMEIVNVNDTFDNSFLAYNGSSVTPTSNGTNWVYWHNVTGGTDMAPGESFELYINMTPLAIGTNVNNTAMVSTLKNLTYNEIVVGFFEGVSGGEVKIYNGSGSNWDQEDVSEDWNFITATALAIGDADNDGYNEIVACFGNIPTPPLKIYKYNLSTGNWDKEDIGDGDLSVAIGDADNDGYNEIVAGSITSGGSIKIYNGSGSNWDQEDICVNLDYPQDLAIGDADNDGYNEVVAGFENLGDIDEGIKIFNGSGSNWDQEDVSGNLGSHSVAIGDADNDGYNEIVAGLDWKVTEELRIYNGSGNNWDENIIGNVVGILYSVAIGDADNDGYNEIVIGNDQQVDQVKIFNGSGSNWDYENVGGFDFRGYGLSLVLSMAIEDADNDGDNEIVATFFHSGDLGGSAGIFNGSGSDWDNNNVTTGSHKVYSVAVGDAIPESPEFITKSYSTLINISNNTIPIVNTTTTSVPDTGNGGGGGGGTPKDPQQSKTWTKITPGEVEIMKIVDKELGFKQIQISVRNQANNVKITVTKLTGRPASVVHEISGKVYKYMEINAENIADDIIESAKIQFEVSKTWINNNKIDKETVALNRYTNKWEKLNTKFTGQDGDYYTYEAESQGFSVFAIAGKTIEKETIPEAIPETISIFGEESICGNNVCELGETDENCPSDCEPITPERVLEIILLISTLAIILLILIMFNHLKKDKIFRKLHLPPPPEPLLKIKEIKSNPERFIGKKVLIDGKIIFSKFFPQEKKFLYEIKDVTGEIDGLSKESEYEDEGIIEGVLKRKKNVLYIEF